MTREEMDKYVLTKEQRDSITVSELESTVLKIMVESDPENNIGFVFDTRGGNYIANSYRYVIPRFYKKHHDNPDGRPILDERMEDIGFLKKIFEVLQRLQFQEIIVEVKGHGYFLTSTYQNGQQRKLEHIKPIK